MSKPETPAFDMEEAIAALREGKDLTGKDGILTPLVKQLTEAALANAIGGSMQYVQPYGDIANIYAPSLNPVRWMSGFGDVFCGACAHTANGLP